MSRGKTRRWVSRALAGVIVIYIASYGPVAARIAHQLVLGTNKAGEASLLVPEFGSARPETQETQDAREAFAMVSKVYAPLLRINRRIHENSFPSVAPLSSYSQFCYRIMYR
jgi:hypothetical protein